jgi:hypothetical protein
MERKIVLTLEKDGRLSITFESEWEHWEIVRMLTTALKDIKANKLKKAKG